MKKVVALVLAVMLALSFAACGGEKTSVNDGEPVTITWLMFGDKQTDQAAVNAKLDEITVPAINAKLDIQYIDSGAYAERMKMNMASGTDTYDMCFVGFNNSYVEAAQKGGLLEITDKLKDYPALYESIPEYEWEGCKIKDKIYAVPNLQVTAYSQGLFVKKDLADEYGLDLDSIKTVNDIEPFLAWVRDNHPEVYPFRGNPHITGFEGLITSYGIAVATDAIIGDDDSVKIVPTYENPNTKAEVALMRDWYNKGYIRKDNATATDDSQDYNAGKFACWMMSYKPGVEAEIYTSKGYEAYAKLITEPYRAGLANVGTMMGININSKNPEKTLEMIELIQTNKELYNLICFGIKDVHYEVVDNRIVQSKQSGYMPTMSWRFGNQFNAELIEGQPDGVWEETMKFNDEARVMPTLGFEFDNKPVRTEIAQMNSVLSKYSGLFRGTVDISEYDKMAEELKAAGAEKVAEEVQKQVNEYLADK